MNYKLIKGPLIALTTTIAACGDSKLFDDVNDAVSNCYCTG